MAKPRNLAQLAKHAISGVPDRHLLSIIARLVARKADARILIAHEPGDFHPASGSE
jgi:hypothetical protein